MIYDPERWRLASAKLVAFNPAAGEPASEDTVTQYHTIVGLFEVATGKDLSSFKIAEDRLKQIPIRRQVGGGSEMSRERYCETRFFFMQLNGLQNYMKIIRDETVSSYEEVKARFKSPAAPQPAPSNYTHIENMHNSTLVQGSPGATVNQHFEIQSDEFKYFVANLKSQLTQMNLAKDDHAQANADLSTVQVQLDAPRPKHTIIRECMASVRTILENAAGSIVAAAALGTINSYFPR